jgi:hypothetical protein
MSYKHRLEIYQITSQSGRNKIFVHKYSKNKLKPVFNTKKTVSRATQRYWKMQTVRNTVFETPSQRIKPGHVISN